MQVSCDAVTRKTDKQSRVTLPDDFANTHVVMERRGENELVIRKASVRPRKYSLAELLAKIPPGWQAEEISTGPAVGLEAEM